MNNKLSHGGDATPLKLDYSLCSKFENCSAPICPLDPESHKRVYLKNERVCAWVREGVKHHGEAVLSGTLDPFLQKVILDHCSSITPSNVPYYSRVKHFSKSPSRFS